MDRQKTRKGLENRKSTCDGLDFSTNGRETKYYEKSKHKRRTCGDKKKYELSPNPYSLNWSPQTRMHSISQRQFSTSDSSVCHYSVPLSLSFEPVSLPIYSALIQTQGNCTVPLEIESHLDRMQSHKKRNKNRQTKSVEQSEPPAMFNTSRLNNGEHQDYTSLPPVNCDIYAAKSSDNDAACKRRFSDPGLGQVSSDDCSSTRSDGSSSSETPEVQSYDFLSLVEQVNELKENNSHLKKELHETKVELETLKMQSLTWRTGSEEFKPGTLSDAISEIRTAVKLGEEALMLKVIHMLERNSNEWKEAQEKLKKDVNERLARLEEEVSKGSATERMPEVPPREATEKATKAESVDIQQQIIELEREKFLLRKELQEAVAKRKAAEATTEKLERLVGILRKKISGVSLESCITDEKHNLVRPLASSLEKNPFIIANNRQGQKFDTLPFAKPRIPPYRAFPLENAEGVNVVVNENKENEAAESTAGKGSSNGNSRLPPSETSSVTAQVTITGPVTDL